MSPGKHRLENRKRGDPNVWKHPVFGWVRERWTKDDKYLGLVHVIERDWHTTMPDLRGS